MFNEISLLTGFSHISGPILIFILGTSTNSYMHRKPVNEISLNSEYLLLLNKSHLFISIHFLLVICSLAYDLTASVV